MLKMPTFSYTSKCKGVCMSVFLAGLNRLKHTHTHTYTNPDIAPLLNWICDGLSRGSGNSIYCIMGNFCSRSFVGAT